MLQIVTKQQQIRNLAFGFRAVLLQKCSSDPDAYTHIGRSLRALFDRGDEGVLPRVATPTGDCVPDSGVREGTAHRATWAQDIHRPQSPEPLVDRRELRVAVLHSGGEDEGVRSCDLLHEAVLALQVIPEPELVAISLQPRLLAALRPCEQPLL